MANLTTQFILYACPEGLLGEQIKAYLARSVAACGANAAHQYMPHCTLTGFFEDVVDQATAYGDLLDRLLTAALPSCSHPVITLSALIFRQNWHGLEVESPWLRQLALQFRDRAESPTRRSPIRPKSWLHLSLAYDFSPDHDAHLRQLAEADVNPDSPVTWSLRFYERRPGNQWICHRNWPLPSPSIAP
ncbi:hypothetical protein [Vacuolonema iberomarrocanum]|uniref:hypothetical protein n=1 Tax=Vacuolonema iberomarrocanum TaxID=3454632 RepID=UPI001A034838|nr:hypothetical protein [filamentous cyanobacterium LEGE 07170]